MFLGIYVSGNFLIANCRDIIIVKKLKLFIKKTLFKDLAHFLYTFSSPKLS